ncbi:MAG: hypothetical protein OEQ74_00430 [Gammaproteobacteria bacterium]|nr:hypothetical protein [Gammaproteobacteria bacterium]
MSSARMLLAAVATGLAACAHTPSEDFSYYLPDIRRAAPVLMVDSDQVPEGLDEHVVIMVDRDTLNRAYQAAGVSSVGQPLYYDTATGYIYRHASLRTGRPRAPSNPSPAVSPVQQSSPTISRRPARVSSDRQSTRPATRRVSTDSRR